MKATNIITSETDMEFCISKMEVITKGSGRMIKWKDLENCIIRMAKLPMRATGAMISSTGKEECTTHSR